ncbi:PREDICTED: uncharacterized protein LOC104805153 [Tarenaya hassleriana]|uniref:uncharacterized protein LOC104805153 n=1 Tax=Tarenaya hassleriana TaxID=28532 RepID=UPI00053C699F|nr:PREDICTED: uncharacterized protein LOC104805153 [Tarenaya hassleriana]XP_010527894.1 PREDICTED: uncharacterized protein LOC104805153 [Tarenaya hassleriana]XP_019057149.1 PREDICTED: uncharacterized protein LOC104805153 [Tarenaya hassleriana]
MLPERRSTTGSVLTPVGQNQHSFLLLRRGRRFGRVVKLKLSHCLRFLAALFLVSCFVSVHKLFFHGSEFTSHFDKHFNDENRFLMSSEFEKGLDRPSVGKPRGSKQKNKHFPCDVALAESVDLIVEPRDVSDFTQFSLGYVDSEKYLPTTKLYKPRFGGQQTLEEREKSYHAVSQTIHCGFVKGPPGFQSTGFELSETDKAYMKNCVVVVSSCIFGSSDFLRRPASKKVSEFSKQNVCFVMFVDEQTRVKLSMEGHVPDEQGYVGLWKIVVVKNLPYADMRKTGKVPKFLSHRLFPSSRYSIWIDSKMRLITDPLLIIEHFLWRTKSEYAISNHYDRHCVWDEVVQNKRLNKYNHSAIDEQFLFYQSDGLKKFDPSDPNSPLPSYVPEGSFIVRAHTPMSNLFSCLWFNEVDRFTSRDQLSFAYTYLKLRRLNPDRPFHLSMFKDCERRALTKLFRHRAEPSPPHPA